MSRNLLRVLKNPRTAGGSCQTSLTFAIVAVRGEVAFCQGSMYSAEDTSPDVDSKINHSGQDQLKDRLDLQVEEVDANVSRGSKLSLHGWTIHDKIQIWTCN